MNKKEEKETPKQYIIVNKNLNMSSGKLAAQVSHASIGALLEFSNNRKQYSLEIEYEKNSALERWINSNLFTKIILYVKSEEKLLSIFKKARKKGIPSVLIEDQGFTEFDKPTYTCVGIGPIFLEEVENITRRLRLL